MNSKPALEFFNAGLELVKVMKLQNLSFPIIQSSLGILIEIAYSLAIILSSIGIIYLVLILKWSSSRI